MMSYRDAEESLEQFHGYRPVCHETIRQVVLKTGVFGNVKVQRGGTDVFLDFLMPPNLYYACKPQDSWLQAIS